MAAPHSSLHPLQSHLGCAVLALSVLAGCAHRAECSAHDGDSWLLVETRHFRVHTNLDAPTAERLARRMEQQRFAATSTWWGEVESPFRLDVVLFARPSELSEFADGWAAGFVAGNADHQWMVMAADAADPLSSTQLHELTHHLASFRLLRQPRWLAEGLAQTFSTAELSEDGTEVVVGKTPWARGFGGLSSRRALTLDELWDWDRIDPAMGRSRRYESSWGWVLFLRHDQPDRFTAFLKALAEGRNPRKAWADAFEGLDSKELEQRFWLFFKAGRAIVLTYPIGRNEPAPARTQPLPPAQVHLLRAKLWGFTPNPALGVEERFERMKREISLAEELEPQSGDVAVAAAGLSPADQRTEVARALAKRLPDAAEAWALLSRALNRETHERMERGSEREAALRRWVALAPQSPSAMNQLAWALAERGDFAEALPLAERAAALAPWDANIADTFAAALAGTGRCALAVQYEERALELLPETVVPRLGPKFQARAEGYRTSCQGR